MEDGAIVRTIYEDILLTDFYAPIAQVLYIDRIIKEHTLMQAIARVNRTYPARTLITMVC